jgi:class 3 adenylate cyclase/predicted ATPase
MTVKAHAVRCEHCGLESPPQFAFCGGCGQALSPLRHVAAPTPGARHTRAAGERRQLTILFADVVDSTRLSETLELEDFRDLVRTYHEICAQIIARNEGFLLQYLGDGVMACFGYPTSYEDNAVRAVETGLSILESIRHVSARIGIHTGMVWLGATENPNVPGASSVLGRVPNTAARIQGLAPANKLVISESTRQLVAGQFEVESLGKHQVKGVARPIVLHVVHARAPAQRRFSRALSQGLRPMIGRQDMRRKLEGIWRAVCEGEGQSIGIRGEAGLGKSRLIQELKEICEATRSGVILLQCWERRHNTAFFPIVDMMSRALNLDPQVEPAANQARLIRFLDNLGTIDPVTVALFASLLALPLPDEAVLAALPSRVQRERTMDALCDLMLRMAQDAPLLVVAEDLQWVDPSTREVLSSLRDRVGKHTILLAFTSRAEIPWANECGVTTIELKPLDGVEARALVRSVAGDRALPEEAIAEIVERAEGVPLFLEELTRAVLESDDYQPADGKGRAIPVSLWDMLFARLEAMGGRRELAHLAATCGQRFSYDLIRAVARVSEEELRADLDRFVGMDLLIPIGEPLGSEYLFRHALLREALYESQVREARRINHGHIADALLRLSAAERYGSGPDILADHLERANRPAEAIPYLLDAGQQATERSASAEAIELLRRGLALLPHLADGPERLGLELKLQLAIASPLVATYGYGAEAVEQTYSRARELCQLAGNAPNLAPVLLGVQFFYMVRARLATAREIGGPLLELGKTQRDPMFELLARRGMGAVRFYSGDLMQARTDLERAVEIYDVDKYGRDAARLFMDSGVSCLSHGAMVSWLLGNPDTAVRLVHAAVDLADRIGHAYSRVFAVCYAAAVHQFRGEVNEVERWADLANAIADEYRFAMAIGWAMAMKGWVAVERGKLSEGLSLMERGEAMWHATGARIISTYWSSFIAAVQGRGGDQQKGIARIDRTLAQVVESGERWCLPELHRVRAELVLQTADSGASAAARDTSIRAALDALEQTIELARSQANRAFELRAVTSLARACARLGRQPDVGATLSQVYAQFDQGLETADLRAARDELKMLQTAKSCGST